jgi:long-chain acyl-CoA synthetase
MAGLIISGERQMTQAELAERAAAAATAFSGLGIGENDTIALMLRNDFAFFEVAAAAALLGAYAVPLNWHSVTEEALYVLKDCGARVLIVHADLYPVIAAHLPAGVTPLLVPSPPEVAAAYGLAEEACQVPEDALRWSDWIADREPWTGPPQALRSNMIYTSGTTGRPKGVRRQPASPENTVRIAETVALGFGFRPGKEVRVVITGPMYHSAPNTYGLRAAQQEGLVVLQPRFDAEDLLRLIDAHRLTHMHVVPTMFIRLLKLPAEVRERYDVSSLEFVVHGAAPCPAEVKKSMIDWWGPVIGEYYGATETGIVIFNDSRQALAKPGTVGTPIRGGEVRIRGDDGNEVGVGEIGEIYLRIASYPDFTYHGKDDKRREIGWNDLVTVGDMGYLDEDGYLFLCDRKNDMVISGGVNIYPAEIEAALGSLAGVHDCAVFGIPHENFGEELCAYVEPEAGAKLSAQAVRQHLGEHVAAFKIPKIIEFRSNLPREDSGKIFKRRLRDPYWQDTGRNI